MQEVDTTVFGSEVRTAVGPDPDCPHCHGRGTIGGCRRECDHVHTYSFCGCVTEREVRT